MTERAHIKKNRPGEDNLTFDTLKREGIEVIQDLSGSVWTDYNIHDPGITILEQLCYALTEIAYRADFDVADYFTDPDGQIDFNGHALLLPEQIFPSQAVTEKDIRKVILDHFPEIENVWLKPVDKDFRELYDFILKLNENDLFKPAEKDKNDLKQRIISFYCERRNLCEDINSITITKNEFYYIHANIEINNERSTVDTLAEIYFRCSQKIDPDVTFNDYEELLKQGKNLEEIFTGPLTRHGFISDEEMYSEREEIHVSEIITEINKTFGVSSVRNFCLLNERKEYVETISYENLISSAPCLKMPDSPDEIHISLFSKDSKIKTSARDLMEKLETLELQKDASRYSSQNFSSLYSLPKGKYRRTEQYYSIQEQFPAIYGINSHGVPESAPPETKARARQLKAYLLIFEQILANSLSNLKNIPRLFSADKTLDRSYFFQVLANDTVPGVNSIYKGYNKKDKDSFRNKLEKTIRRHDNVLDRRNRFLDYMLALYGEKFSQALLSHYNFYYTKEELDEIVIKNKIGLLKKITEISRDRGKSFNYQEISWNTKNVSGLKMKISLLLGLPMPHSRSLTAVFISEGLKIISDEKLSKTPLGSLELKFASLDRLENRISNNFYEIHIDKKERNLNSKSIKNLFTEIILLKNNVINESFLKFGIRSEKYRVGSFTSDKSYQVIFKPYEGAEWCYLATYDSKEKAEQSINNLHRFIRHLNIRSEGFHILEHLLLRPLSQKKHHIPVPDGFYSFRITLLFPSWTARFSDPGFRRLAEETVQANCPAHILTDFFWLDFDRMLSFELLYKRWLILKSSTGEDKSNLDAQSEKIIQFISDLQP